MSNQAEYSKRGAAGLAKTTKGRSRVFKDKTKYDRKVNKSLAKAGDSSFMGLPAQPHFLI